MTTTKTYTIILEKNYQCSGEVIFNLFGNSTVFKLTGADDIQIDFVTGGLFCLSFKDRGIIHGRFIKVTGNKIIMEWNVGGFQRPPEINTLVEISLRTENGNCILSLHHKNIMHDEAAAAKKRAWTEILDAIEEYYEKTNPE